jgi:hypothetical protein
MPQTQWEFLASMLSLATAVAAAILLASGIVPARFVDSMEAMIRRWASRPLLCFILIPSLSLAANACIALHNGVPHPKIHDEFSYLLASDTFSHARLTNPTPQELMRPTRMSKYPPGQGIALMIGQVMAGEPIVGVWLSTAAACAAIYWMLLVFVRLPWAMLGGITAAVSPALLDWSQNYWGGSVAVRGGALLVGAWGRLMIQKSVWAWLWLGIGLLILANSRPYEGLVLCVPLLAELVLRRHFRSAWPCGVVLLLGGAWMGYYNFRITGHALRMPFAEYSAQYDVYPKFWFQAVRPMPMYRNPSQQWVHTRFEKGSYQQLRTVPGFVRISFQRAWIWISGSLKPAVLLLPVAMSILLWRDLRIRWLLITGAIFLIGLWAESFVLPHYTAPALPVLLLLCIAGWSKLRSRGATGLLLARVVGIGLLAGTGMSAAQGVSADSQIIDQQTLASKLGGGLHLIFVKYEPGYRFSNEFVYNPADLDQSRVIWAHYFGPAADAPVTAHFSNRQVWLLDAGDSLKLNAYDPANDRLNPR